MKRIRKPALFQDYLVKDRDGFYDCSEEEEVEEGTGFFYPHNAKGNLFIGVSSRWTRGRRMFPAGRMKRQIFEGDFQISSVNFYIN